MNYIKHLTGFFEKVVQDKTLNPTHISLYIALFQCWNCNRFKNPISISRDEVMRISKISSKATYHKCLKNLHSLGYINYEPSFNPFRGSHVYLFNFSDDLKPQPKSERKPKNEPLIDPASEQALNKSYTSSETSTEQAVVPSINYINKTNNLNIENVSNLNEQAKNVIAKNEAISKNNSSDKIVIPSEVEGTQKEKSAAKKEKKESCHTELVEVSPNQKSTPSSEEVKSYFQENNFPELEAQKFFNYFSSNGWLVGGKTPMINWQAAAQNWMLNSINFNHNTDTNPTNRPKHLNTTTDKDYSEPL
jgi:hypothetical protein